MSGAKSGDKNGVQRNMTRNAIDVVIVTMMRKMWKLLMLWVHQTDHIVVMERNQIAGDIAIAPAVIARSAIETATEFQIRIGIAIEKMTVKESRSITKETLDRLGIL